MWNDNERAMVKKRLFSLINLNFPAKISLAASSSGIQLMIDFDRLFKCPNDGERAMAKQRLRKNRCVGTPHL